jgi:hypothetical protein
MKLAEKNANDAREVTLAMQKVVAATKRLDTAIREAVDHGLDLYLTFTDRQNGEDCSFNFYRDDQRLSVTSCGWGPVLPEFPNEPETTVEGSDEDE